MWSLRVTRITLLGLAGLVGVQLSPAQSYTVVHAFSGTTDGANPKAAPVLDSAGNLYGTTSNGGVSNLGVVYELNVNGGESVLYNFSGGTDGANPADPVLLGANGAVYGTAQNGGGAGQGVAFDLSAVTGALATLHAFQVRKDGNYPGGRLVQDPAGNLYGTTISGGSSNRGTIFEIKTSGTEAVLHNFRGKTDGSYPYSGLIRDSAGSLYGTTYGAGATCGTVFKLAFNPKVETVLHGFCAKGDGASPYAGLIMDSGGILYGTTVYGGSHGAGTIFKLDPVSLQETILYNFSGGTDGGDPYGGLVMDSAGNLYGTTYYGGTVGYGTIFKLDSAGHETVLHSFTGGSDGIGPMAGLTFDGAGNLYGTTLYGGANGFGVVFKLVP